MSLAVLVIVASVAASSNARQGETLMRAPKAGDGLTWRQQAALRSTLLPIGLTTTVEERVTTVEPSGAYSVDLKQGKVYVNWAGELLSSPDETTAESYRCNARGELLEYKAGPFDNGWGARAYDLQTVIAPTSSVGVGDTWSFEFRSDPEMGTVKARGEYKLISAATLDGVEAYEVAISVREAEGSAPASSSGTVWLRKTDGAPIKVEVSLTNAALPGIPGLAAGKFSRQILRG